MKLRSTLIRLVWASFLVGSAANSQLIEVDAGAPSDSSAINKLSGVPSFNVYQKKIVGGKTEVFRLKTIPEFRIGRERQVKQASLVFEKFSLESFRAPPLPKIKTVQLSPVTSNQHIIVEAVAIDPTKVTEKSNTANLVAIEVAPLKPPGVNVTPDTSVSPAELAQMGPSELKLLQAQIFLHIHKNYPLAVGLLSELLDEDKVISEQAIYDLGETCYQLGLYSEYKFQMRKLLNSKNKNWRAQSILSLMQKISKGDIAFAKELNDLRSVEKIELKSEYDQFLFNLAKSNHNEGRLDEAISLLDQVPSTSPLYFESLYLKAITLYKKGQLNEAITGIELALVQNSRPNEPTALRPTAHLTLARLQFQKGDYTSAFNNYLKIDRKNSQWLQAMVERAWAQILAKDYEGAAGNMFSLHTEFLRKSFHPESYTVRTISYLNLCQYGDALKVITEFNKKYTPVMSQLDTFATQFSQPIQVYETIRLWAKDPSQKFVNGLSKEFIFALTRNPLFLENQENLNSIEDQITKLNRLTVNLISQEKSLIAEISKSRQNQSRLKPSDRKFSEINSEIETLRIQHYIAKKARTSIRDLRQRTFARLSEEKEAARITAGVGAQKVLLEMQSTLKASLDQSDILKYEIFSGAGDQVRFQLAGGETPEKSSEALKSQNAVNWDFRGEVWEDEIGHFRSSLKNVCPAEDTEKE